MSNVANLIESAKQQIAEADNLQLLDQIRIQFLGKNGQLTALLKSLGNLSSEERAKTGQIVNAAKAEIQQLIQHQNDFIRNKQLAEKLAQQKIDVTLPGRGRDIGGLHPITKVLQRMQDLFATMGFIVVEGPEIEDEFHNFEALNIPAYHPARTTMDTFYLQDYKLLLRTHTSPVQIRALQKLKVPLRAIAPGRVYRRDSDATHSPMFHQLEGLMVDEHTSFADLKGVLYNFLENFFAQKVKLRFRPSYFPFTEPSAEVDLQCVLCEGKGCAVCKNSGWIEVLGCGMVHPNVLKAVAVDAERYTGFAFGMGIDRFAMIYYGISDLRMLFDNDLRFLEQF